MTIAQAVQAMYAHTVALLTGIDDRCYPFGPPQPADLNTPIADFVAYRIASAEEDPVLSGPEVAIHHIRWELAFASRAFDTAVSMADSWFDGTYDLQGTMGAVSAVQVREVARENIRMEFDAETDVMTVVFELKISYQG